MADHPTFSDHGKNVHAYLSMPTVIDPPSECIDGVSHEVALTIADSLQDGRRRFGSLRANSTNRAHQPWGALNTADVLSEWLADKPGAVLVGLVDIDCSPESKGSLACVAGYVVLVGSEVILIELANWEPNGPYTLGDKGDVLCDASAFVGNGIRMPEAISSWLRYLHDDASVIGMVCIDTEGTKVFRNRNWYTNEFRLVEVGRLVELLDDKWRVISEYDRTHINSTLVSQVAVRRRCTPRAVTQQ